MSSLCHPALGSLTLEGEATPCRPGWPPFFSRQPTIPPPSLRLRFSRSKIETIHQRYACDRDGAALRPPPPHLSGPSCPTSTRVLANERNHPLYH